MIKDTVVRALDNSMHNISEKVLRIISSYIDYVDGAFMGGIIILEIKTNKIK
ncbi:hypothetical protein [Clostridium estertheticum]|uniref:hypothetical protein n=1 Tax=Clostridium estertheticum TaxID=238834 RepID=UPI001CF11F91|nr:hypothetical protein [Clostridium estertheticum]MCB2353556.1 hypothetical protein [Clostridium estertheticum]WAG41891.1 hypothetical protein LL065_04055 [Clostridium estertheticum]